MKNKHLHRIFALTLTLIVLFPFTLQALHVIENHEHQICTAKDVKHIHQQNIDCSIYHKQITTNSFDFSAQVELSNPIFINSTKVAYTIPEYSVFHSLKSSRAPPYFII